MARRAFGRPLGGSVDRPVARSVCQLVGRLDGPSVGRAFGRSVGWSVVWSLCRPIGSFGRPVVRSGVWSICWPASLSIGRPVVCSSWLVGGSSVWSACRQVGRLVGLSAPPQQAHDPKTAKPELQAKRWKPIDNLRHTKSLSRLRGTTGAARFPLENLRR